LSTRQPGDGQVNPCPSYIFLRSQLLLVAYTQLVRDLANFITPSGVQMSGLRVCHEPCAPTATQPALRTRATTVAQLLSRSFQRAFCFERMAFHSRCMAWMSRPCKATQRVGSVPTAGTSWPPQPASMSSRKVLAWPWDARGFAPPLPSQLT